MRWIFEFEVEFLAHPGTGLTHFTQSFSYRNYLAVVLFIFSSIGRGVRRVVTEYVQWFLMQQNIDE